MRRFTAINLPPSGGVYRSCPNLMPLVEIQCTAEELKAIDDLLVSAQHIAWLDLEILGKLKSLFDSSGSNAVHSRGIFSLAESIDINEINMWKKNQPGFMRYVNAASAVRFRLGVLNRKGIINYSRLKDVWYINDLSRFQTSPSNWIGVALHQSNSDSAFLPSLSMSAIEFLESKGFAAIRIGNNLQLFEDLKTRSQIIYGSGSPVYQRKTLGQ